MARSSTLRFCALLLLLSLNVSTVDVCLTLSQYPSISITLTHLWPCMYLISGHWALTLIPPRLLSSLSISDRDGRLRRSDCCCHRGKMSLNMTVQMYSSKLTTVYLYCLLFVYISCSMILYENRHVNICSMICILHFNYSLICLLMFLCVIYAFFCAFTVYHYIMWNSLNSCCFPSNSVFQSFDFPFCRHCQY